jgi:hypothetical protein
VSGFKELNDELKGIGLNPQQLEKMMSDELAHFQCLKDGRYVRVLTRSCSFSFDLAFETAKIETQETIALHVIRRAKQKLTKKTRECAALKMANRRLNQDVDCLREECDSLAKWKSRCMKMVRKARKPKQSRKEVVS